MLREEGKTKAMGWKGENGLRWLELQTGRAACGPLNVLKTVCWLRERERERREGGIECAGHERTVQEPVQRTAP